MTICAHRHPRALCSQLHPTLFASLTFIRAFPLLGATPRTCWLEEHAATVLLGALWTDGISALDASVLRIVAAIPAFDPIGVAHYISGYLQLQKPPDSLSRVRAFRYQSSQLAPQQIDFDPIQNDWDPIQEQRRNRSQEHSCESHEGFAVKGPDRHAVCG